MLRRFRKTIPEPLPRLVRGRGVFTVSPIGGSNLGHYLAPAALADAESISLEEARQWVAASAAFGPGDTSEYGRVILEHPVSFLKAYMSSTLSNLFGYGRTSQDVVLGEPFPPAELFERLWAGDLRSAWAQFVDGLRRPAQVRALVLTAALMGVPVLAWGSRVPPAVEARRRGVGPRPGLIGDYGGAAPA